MNNFEHGEVQILSKESKGQIVFKISVKSQHQPDYECLAIWKPTYLFAILPI